MIDRGYCVVMSRYNTWQNRQLVDLLEVLDPAEVTRDRKAFFGSILGTLNHLLWGDHIWMSRLDGGNAPEGGIDESTRLCPDLANWKLARVQMDRRIESWATSLIPDHLTGDLSWLSGATGKTERKPVAMCIAHVFNHQTHHRGQVHAMMTAAGGKGTVSDLVFMPEDV